MRLFKGVGGYLREVFEKAQPLGTRWDPLLDFSKKVGVVFLTQL